VIAGIVTLLALATLVASLTWLHLQPTGLSPLRNAVSQYGISAYRGGYRVATLAFAAAGIALAVGISARLHARAHTVDVLLVVFAAARSVISWFPMDTPGAELTATGRRHGLLALAAFAGVTAAALKLSHSLAHGTVWHQLAPVSSGLGWLMLVLLLAMGLRRSLPSARAWFGAVERAFYVAAIVWFAVFAIACVTTS
jgi:Protein of unknown function (DUF998)